MLDKTTINKCLWGIKHNIIFFLCVDKLTDVTLLRSIVYKYLTSTKYLLVLVAKTENYAAFIY